MTLAGPGDAAWAQAPPRRPVRAAEASPVRPHSAELNIGGLWLGGVQNRDASANETSNAGGDPFTLFRVRTRVTASPGVTAMLAYNLTERLAVEARASYSRPSVVAEVSGDAEGASKLVLSGSPVSEYGIDGGVVVHLGGRLWHDRGVPFLSAGAGYLRQVHEGALLVQTGQIYRAGGGLKYFFRSRPDRWLKRVGVRGEVEGRWRVHGVDLQEASRGSMALGGTLALGF